MATHTPSLSLSEDLSFLPLFLIATALSTVLALVLGLWALAALPVCFLVLKLIPDLRLSFLLFLCFLPALGELEVHAIRPHIWLPFYAILVASWLYHAAIRPKQIYVHGSLTVAYCLFLLICTLSLIGSYDLSPIAAGKDFLRGPYRAMWEGLLVSGLGIFSMSAFETEDQLERIFWVVILSSLLLYVPSLFLTEIEIEESGQIGRFVGLFSSPHTAAIHMLFCTILSLSLLKHASGTSRTILLLATCVFLGTQYLTSVKTIFVIIPIVFLLSVFLEKGLKMMLGYAALLTVGGMAVFPFLPISLQTTFEQIFVAFFVDYTKPVANQGGVVSTFAPRVEDWWTGFDLLTRDLSLLGVGFGKSMFAIKPFVQYHVYYVLILAETGIIGLLIFLSIILITLFIAFRCLRYFKRMNHAIMYTLTKGLILSFVTILISFTALPGALEGSRLFWVLVGLISVTDRIMKRTQLQNAELSPAQ